jgi:hypothetical protein
VTRLEDIATRFVEARLAAAALPEFPGEVPLDLKTGYLCQDLAIDLWPDANSSRTSAFFVGGSLRCPQVKIGLCTCCS